MRTIELTAAIVAAIAIAHEAYAATTFASAPADEFVFYFDPSPPQGDEGPPASMPGLPNGTHVDFDGGGVTVRFLQTLQDFDFAPTEIPVGTDIIIVDADSLDVPGLVGFGYGQPTDGNGDGIADVLAGSAVLLGTAAPISYSWSLPGHTSGLIFYDLDSAAGFAGVTQDFFLAIDDTAGDQEIDAVLINQIPEPSTVILAAIGLVCLAVLGRRRLGRAKQPQPPRLIRGAPPPPRLTLQPKAAPLRWVSCARASGTQRIARSIRIGVAARTRGGLERSIPWRVILWTGSSVGRATD